LKGLVTVSVRLSPYIRVPRLFEKVLNWGFVYERARPLLEPIAIERWKEKGSPLPVPHWVKQATLREYQRAFQLPILVETGTFLGDTVRSLKRDFEEIYTIELDEALYRKAKRRFARCHYICVIQGDSGERLPDVLARVSRPCLFWLDGHYSGGITAKGAENTPILRELTHILHHRLQGHVVLIDDADAFTGQDGYPTLRSLQESVRASQPQWSIEVANNIIRLHAPRARQPEGLGTPERR
jgi:hypothetical protein